MSKHDTNHQFDRAEQRLSQLADQLTDLTYPGSLADDLDLPTRKPRLHRKRLWALVPLATAALIMITGISVLYQPIQLTPNPAHENEAATASHPSSIHLSIKDAPVQLTAVPHVPTTTSEAVRPKLKEVFSARKSATKQLQQITFNTRMPLSYSVKSLQRRSQ